MGLLHRLRRKKNRRVVGGNAPIRWRLAPAPSGFRAAGLTGCAVVAGAAIIWASAGGSAQAVTTSTTPTTLPSQSTTSTTLPYGITTTTTAFTLQGDDKTQVDSLQAQADQVQAQIDDLNDQLEQKTELYNKCLEDLDAANARMGELRRTVADAQSEKSQRQDMLADRVTAMYKSGGRDQLLQIILTADGLDDLYKRVHLVTTIADQDRDLVSGLKDSSNRLDLLLKAVDAQKREQLKLRNDLEQAARDIQDMMAQKQQTLAQMDQQVARLIAESEARAKVAEQQLNEQFVANMQATILAAQQAANSHVLNGAGLYTGILPQSDNAAVNQLIQTAASYMGITYVWGGSKPSTGMDCSGFTRYVFKQHGVNLPHYSGYQAQMGTAVSPADLQPGDLLAFGSPVHHVGIYIGEGLYIHTPSEVKISRLSERSDLTAIRRFPITLRTGAPLFE
jgi:peptidoglycan DL-endopeptidase CwlO